MKGYSLKFVCVSLIVLFLTPHSQAQPKALCVPWKPADATIPHSTYSGANITLKGIARGGATQYYWDYGDGSPAMSWTAISNSYNLGVKHTYTGAVGQLFIATLHIRDGGGNTDQDTYPIIIRQSSDLGNPAHLDVRIDMAIDEGLWYLHTTMNRGTYSGGAPGYGQPYGYWTDTAYGYHIAATGTSVDAFQLHGSRVNGDYDGDPYVETVQRALNYVLVYTYSFNINTQPAGDPDTNGNGIGLVTNHSNYLYDTRQTYIGGICMAALASSGPTRTSSRIWWISSPGDRMRARLVIAEVGATMPIMAHRICQLPSGRLWECWPPSRIWAASYLRSLGLSYRCT